MQYELSHFAKDVANVSQEIPRILNIMTWSVHGFNFYCIMLRELILSLFYFSNDGPPPAKKQKNIYIRLIFSLRCNVLLVSYSFSLTVWRLDVFTAG